MLRQELTLGNLSSILEIPKEAIYTNIKDYYRDIVQEYKKALLKQNIISLRYITIYFQIYSIVDPNLLLIALYITKAN